MTSSAFAQRSFVSAVTGSDGNNCSRSAPCRSFGTAIGAVGAGGEVVVLDSGGYGPVTITKAITIESPAGIYAGISADNGISVNAAASDNVTLRGLTLKALTPGSGAAVRVISGSTLTIENCVLNGWANGVEIISAGALIARDSVFQNMADDGIKITPTSGNVFATVVRCQFENNLIGILARENAKAWARDCVFTGNFIGAAARCDTATSAELDVRNCLVNNNNNGLFAEANGPGATALVRVSGCMIMGNVSYGLVIFNASSVIESYGDNDLRGNGMDVFGGPLTPIGSTRQ